MRYSPAMHTHAADEGAPPPALTRWFVVHFVADLVFAVPLLLVPETFLRALGWQVVDPVAARIVAAALCGIGIESWRSRRARISAFPALLELKIIWSWAAMIGLLLSVIEGSHAAPGALWALVVVFAGFNVLWTYWRRRILAVLRAAANHHDHR